MWGGVGGGGGGGGVGAVQGEGEEVWEGFEQVSWTVNACESVCVCLCVC